MTFEKEGGALKDSQMTLNIKTHTHICAQKFEVTNLLNIKKTIDLN